MEKWNSREVKKWHWPVPHDRSGLKSRIPALTSVPFATICPCFLTPTRRLSAKQEGQTVYRMIPHDNMEEQLRIPKKLSKPKWHLSEPLQGDPVPSPRKLEG